MEIAVIGLGRFGRQVAETLSELGHEVLAVDANPDLVEAIKDKVAHAVCTDSTVETNLRAIGVAEVDSAVVGIGENVEANIMTCAILKGMGISRVVARAVRPMQRNILKKIGVNRVLLLEEIMGEQVARSLSSAQILESVAISEGFSLHEIVAPAFLVGKTLEQSQLRLRYGVNVVAIKKRKSRVNEAGEMEFEYTVNELPGPQDIIQSDDVLLLVGSNEKLSELAKG